MTKEEFKPSKLLKMKRLYPDSYKYLEKVTALQIFQELEEGGYTVRVGGCVNIPIETYDKIKKKYCDLE